MCVCVCVCVCVLYGVSHPRYRGSTVLVHAVGSLYTCCVGVYICIYVLSYVLS